MDNIFHDNFPCCKYGPEIGLGGKTNFSSILFLLTVNSLYIFSDSGAGAIIFVEVFVVPVWCYIVIAILAALLLISLIIIIILWRRKSQKQSEETNSTPTSEGYSHVSASRSSRSVRSSTGYSRKESSC